MANVTILIPVYGVEQYMEACAVSLFQQTYPDITFVFCNDCTPDRSMDILQETIERFPQRQEHVKIISNDGNKGLGATRAHLVTEVHGDYFMIVDSDDVLPLNAVELLVKRMQETDVDIVDGAYAEYNNSQLGTPILSSHASDSTYLNKVLCQNLISLRVWGKLYKSSVLHRIPNLFFEGIDFAEDVCASTRLAAVTSRAWIDEVVYWYRTDNISSYTKNISKKNLLSYFRAMREIIRFYHARGRLSLSLEVGVLNVYRECRRSGLLIQEANDILHYKPEHQVAKLLYSLFRQTSVPLCLSDYLYRFVRSVVSR